MSDENIVPLSHAPSNARGQTLSITTQDGQAAFIDVVTGDTYDAKGNSLGRWAPMDSQKTEEQNKQLGIYAANFDARSIAASVLTTGYAKDQELVRDQARSVMTLSAVNSEEARAQALDIGVGDVHIPSAMPNFVTGYSNGTPVADIYSPPLVVQKQSDYYYQFQKEDAFQRAVPNIGAPGAGVQRVQPRFGNTQYKAISRAYGGFIPTEVEANQDAPLRLKQATINRMMNVAKLERELRVSTLARTSGNWNSATTILAAAKWNGGASSDPVADINAAVEASYGKPNGMILSERTWNAMRRNTAVRSYYTYSGSAPGMISEQQMVSLLQIPTVYVADMKYIDSAGALKYVWGDDVLIFRRATQIPPMSQDETASSYTFRWVGPGMGAAPDVDPTLSPSRGYVVRQFFNQYEGPLGGMQLVLFHSDAEKQTSAYVGNLLVSAYQA